jgi:hypothetical protein
MLLAFAKRIKQIKVGYMLCMAVFFPMIRKGNAIFAEKMVNYGNKQLVINNMGLPVVFVAEVEARPPAAAIDPNRQRVGQMANSPRPK